MPFALQKQATGLLGWLALKIGGRNPTGFGETVMPVIEVGDNYLLQGETRFPTTNTASGTVNRYLQTVTVPAAKQYRWLGAGGNIQLNAADVAITSHFICQLIDPSDTNAICIWRDPFPMGYGGFTLVRDSGFLLSRPLILTAGWKISYGWQFSAALTVSVAANLGVYRQEIDV